ncbi:MAG: AI-2E family transporter [Patescibacteria group bacterium]
MEKRQIDISTGIIFRAILIILALWFLYLVRDVIALIFVSILIVSAIDPAVDWMQKKKIPRSVGVSIIYLFILAVISLSVSFLIPPLVEQFRDFSQKIPQFSQALSGFTDDLKIFFGNENVVGGQQAISGFGSEFSSLSGKIFTRTVGFFSGFISVIVILAMAFYMAVKENGIKNFIVSVTPEKHKQYAAHLTERIKIKMGRWMQGQLVLMVIIFALDFIGLSLLKVPYALALALFAGIMEVVPYLGPIISAFPGVILGFTISPFTGFMAILLYWLAQQFENYVVVPQIMKKAVGLNPITVIVALLIGIKLGGIFGAILAIPIAAAVGVVTDDFMKENPAA